MLALERISTLYPGLWNTQPLPLTCASRRLDVEATHVQQSREKLCRLLELTRPAWTWQPHLLELLNQNILEDQARRTLAFLQHVLVAGRETLEEQCSDGSGSLTSGQLVPLDRRLAPAVLDVDRWKTILIALGFEIEQPDGLHSLDAVDVLVGEGVLAPALDGMLTLLDLINSLPWNILRMLLSLSPEEAMALCSLTECTGPDVSDQRSASALLARYPDELGELGFRQQRRVAVRAPGLYRHNRLASTVSLVLRAVFEQAVPGADTFV